MNNEISFGGNIIRSVKDNQSGKHLFADSQYTYFMYVLNSGDVFTQTELQSYTIFVLSLSGNSRIEIPDVNKVLKQGEAVVIEGMSPQLRLKGNQGTILVAGVKNGHSGKKEISVIPANMIYKVDKPWGHELWINGRHPFYSMKEIFIKMGNKTSLQFHRLKSETNVLFSGRALLHYNDNPEIASESVRSENISTKDILPITSIDITPPTVHRLEALSDILLYEVSTPHLDDVVRILDDSGRPDGLIKNEHKA